MKIAIIGRPADTANYIRFVQSVATPLVTLDMDAASCCQGLLFPGGGDIAPAFFGEENHGSRNIKGAGGQKEQKSWRRGMKAVRCHLLNMAWLWHT